MEYFANYVTENTNTCSRLYDGIHTCYRIFSEYLKKLKNNTVTLMYCLKTSEDQIINYNYT